MSNEKDLIQVFATQDGEGHWYVVPVDLKDEFDRLLDGGETTENEFIEQFSQYMTGGDLNLVQLYIKPETFEETMERELAEDYPLEPHKDNPVIQPQFPRFLVHKDEKALFTTYATGQWPQDKKQSALEMVEEFHQAFNCPVLKTPGIPDTMTDKNLSFYRDLCVILEEMKKHNDRSRSALRVKLVFEEFLELYEALLNADIVAALDALSDLLYVTYGTHHELGLGPIARPALAEVHRSNMSKLNGDGNPIVRNDGKILKGPNFSPPNLAGIIDQFFMKRDVNDVVQAVNEAWKTDEWRNACENAIKEGDQGQCETAELKAADSVIGVMPVISAELGNNMPVIQGMPDPTGAGVIYSDLKHEFPDHYERQVLNEQPPVDGNY
jgi:predicted HAD superfamily Cof-like phosphohydrolase